MKNKTQKIRFHIFGSQTGYIQDFQTLHTALKFAKGNIAFKYHGEIKIVKYIDGFAGKAYDEGYILSH